MVDWMNILQRLPLQAMCVTSLFILLTTAACSSDEVVELQYKVVNTYPHDRNAFTQGLFFRDGQLFESTGQYGTSSIRKVTLETGRVQMQYDLDDRLFGEGIVDWQDRLIAITWKSGTGFVFGLEDFRKRSTFQYAGEGWGLTRNDSHIIMSDGTERIRFLNPETLEEEKSISVTLQGRKQDNLNELEWIDGLLYSNVWHSDRILIIDPDTGRVTRFADLSGLLPSGEKMPGFTGVLNGIAWDADARRLFVTGKNWPKLFEIELFETNAGN